MKEIKEMEMQDIINLDYITKLKIAGGGDVALIRNFVQTYIDPKCYVCDTCSAQIRLAHSRACDFYKRHQVVIEERRSLLGNMDEVIKKYWKGGAYYKFGDVQVKGKEMAIKYYQQWQN